MSKPRPRAGAFSLCGPVWGAPARAVSARLDRCVQRVTVTFVRRVSDFLENAKACRDLARKMPPEQRQQLIDMARQWEEIAEERRRSLSLNLDGE